MAQFKVADVQEKNADWKVISIEMSEESFQEEVSVNRKSKKEGEGDFPSFDSIKPGYTVAGELWQSGTGKWYLFAPRAPKASTGGQGGGMRGVAAAQQRKGDMIEKSQDRKERGIMVSAAFRDSTSLLVATGLKFETDEEMWEKHKEYRDRYIKEWELAEQSADKPF